MQFITGKHMPRRTFLRGMGATVALPFLDAMVPATAFGATARTIAANPTRLVCVEEVHGLAGCTTFGGQPCSMRYAVAPTSMYAAASSHVRRAGLGTHWWSWTFVYCAKLPQFDSYPQICWVGANIGSLPARTHGSSGSHMPQ